VAADTAKGITPRAAITFALLREAATARCSECGVELCPTEVTSNLCSGADGEVNLPTKRSRKTKASRTNTRANSPATTQAPRAMMTRCQHVFCTQCFKRKMNWPDGEPDVVRPLRLIFRAVPSRRARLALQSHSHSQPYAEEPHKIKDRKKKSKQIEVATWAQRFPQTLCSSLANKTALIKSPDRRLHPNVSRRARSLSPLTYHFAHCIGSSLDTHL
jgi:hypothetical protein